MMTEKQAAFVRSPLQNAIWEALFNVMRGYTTKRHMLAVAMLHRGGTRMVQEALEWGLIDTLTYDAWHRAYARSK